MNDGQCSDEHAVEVVNVEEEGSLSSLNDLPDDLLLLIFNRLIDLKCLCLCSLVSPRFSSLVFQVHSVYLTIPRSTTTHLIPTPVVHPATDGLVIKTLKFFNAIVAKPLQIFRQFKSIGSLFFTIELLNKFKSLRSLHLLHHISSYSPNPNDDDSIYRWAAKLSPTIDTFVFLSISSIRIGGEIDFDVQEQEEDPEWLHELMSNRVTLALDCLQDAMISHRLLRSYVLISEHPLLDNIKIADSKMKGCLSLRDSKIVEMRNWLKSSSKTELNRTGVPVNIHYLHLPVLKLPVSSKVMVSPSLVLMEMVDKRHERRDWGVEAESISSLFSEQGEEEFAEAIVEMMANHNSRMQTII